MLLLMYLEKNCLLDLICTQTVWLEKSEGKESEKQENGK